MTRRTSPFPVRKPYLRVQRDLGTSNSSSIGKPDLLSYSYSCVQEFKKNQHIIGNLAILHEDDEYQGLSHQPELFTLSGERENPVCQPFYCSSAVSDTDRTETANLFETSNIPKFSIEEIIQSSANTIIDSEPVIFDKSFLLQWLKYQMKYVNSWWPFSKKDYFFTRLCKKEKTMKMEMMLNNVDEETKFKIKRYVAELNLNLEERNNLCNESIIEIDITPIFTDTSRLQAFLLFLKNIESSCPKLISSQQQKHYNSFENNTNFSGDVFVDQVTKRRSLFQTNTLNMRRKFNKINNNKMENNIGDFHKDNKNVLFDHPNRFNESSNYKHRNFNNNKAQVDYNKRNEAIRRKHLRVDIKSNQKVNKKPRLKSTFAVNLQNAEIFHDDSTNNVGVNVPQTINKRMVCDKKGYCAQAAHTSYQPNCLKNSDKKPSCKCLIHQQREDYHRYKNQCLFGRGDETTSNLIKFVAINENKLLTSCKSKEIANSVSEASKTHNKNEAKSFNTKENYERNITRKRFHDLLEDNSRSTSTNKHLVSNSNHNYEKHSKPSVSIDSVTNENISVKHKSYFSKHIKSSDEISDAVTCDSIVDQLCFNAGNCQVVHRDDVEKFLCAIDYNKDSFSSKKADSLKTTIESDRLGESSSENGNTLSFNACFESLNYSFNSFTWNETASRLTEVENESESTNSRRDYTAFLRTDFPEKIAGTQENKSLRSQAIGNKTATPSLRETALKNKHQSGFNNGNLGVGEYITDFINKDVKQMNNDLLLNYKITPCYDNLDESAMQKINLFVSNARELHNKMAYLSKKLRLKGKERDNNYGQNMSTSEEFSKINMVIKISSSNIGNKTGDKKLKPSKINFNSFRPTNIYQSISSIFKGTPNNYEFSKGKHQEYFTASKRQTSIIQSKEYNKHASYDQQMSSFLIRQKNTNANQTKNSSVSLIPPCPKKLDNLIFNNLNKLNTELKSQRNEIEALKYLILEQNKH